jgi:PTH1 family peptidyl-tRNA hydrolase
VSLFQRNPFADAEHKPLYTLGLNKSVLIVGLGNIGKEFENTRHNIGFACLDSFAAAHNIDNWVAKKDLRCRLAMGTVGNSRVLLCKPATMMNLSGEAVQAVQHFYKLSNKDTLVVHDELDVAFGQIRCRIGGSHAGNNGVKSLIEQVGEDFGRVRVGIGPKTPQQIDSADFVLENFSKEEQAHLKDLKKEVTAVITEYIASGNLPHDTRNFLL